MTRQDKPAGDALTPFEQALRDRVPSREALLAEAKAQTARQRRRKQALGGGLSLLVLATGLWFLDPSWYSEDIRVPVGSRDSRQLADGSSLILDSASHLRIEHRLRSRQFELLEGEATFTVAHGPQPFIVRSQGVSVRDIGTVFNVRSDSRGVAVTVVEGEVEVSNQAARARRMQAGQLVLANAQQFTATGRVDPARIIAWQQGKLRFDGTPLREAVIDLQRYRQAPIRLADARVGQMRLSGEFDSDAVEALLDGLPTILPLNLVRDSDGSVTIRAR
ncbi:FecR domain-containing protein [Pseudomonas sp. 148P]|uniref:FecR domain-containing protein n=1 Tax=Pseudomonas ulcerans TaxID=3115852 RepID=A0ABU7HU84_9PSED|nr:MULTISPECIES: FecR domain-containing protein [unclassified Pseudomonas]MEE1923929.1 FecR domain-containing protein [Pseudomonas sp. 147P]MEE1935106.1 FecR domain-containing protein [Pseudomonas sp. 148P]